MYYHQVHSLITWIIQTEISTETILRVHRSGKLKLGPIDGVYKLMAQGHSADFNSDTISDITQADLPWWPYVQNLLANFPSKHRYILLEKEYQTHI